MGNVRYPGTTREELQLQVKVQVQLVGQRKMLVPLPDDRQQRRAAEAGPGREMCCIG